MPGTYNLPIDQGGTFTRIFTWTDDADVPRDLSGCTATAKIYEEGVPNPALELAPAVSDPTAGKIELEITDEQTDALLWPKNAKGSWRLDVHFPNGTTTPLLKGTVTVNRRDGS